MSIYIPSHRDGKPAAKATADKLIDIVDRLISRFPEKFARVQAVEDVHRNFKPGKSRWSWNGKRLGAL